MVALLVIARGGEETLHLPLEGYAAEGAVVSVLLHHALGVKELRQVVVLVVEKGAHEVHLF